MININFSEIINILLNPLASLDHLDFAKKICVYLINNELNAYHKGMQPLILNIDNEQIELTFDLQVTFRPRREGEKRKPSSFWIQEFPILSPTLSKEDNLLLNWTLNIFDSACIEEGARNEFKISIAQLHWIYNQENNTLTCEILAKNTKGLLTPKSPENFPIRIPSKEVQQLIKEMLRGEAYWVKSSENSAVNIIPRIKGQGLEYHESNIVKKAQEVLEPLIFRYLIELYRAVHYMHLNQIAHLDIKLENIILTEDTNRLMLIDFQFSEPLNLKTLHKGSKHYVPWIYYSINNNSIEKIYTEKTKVYQDIFGILLVIGILGSSQINTAFGNLIALDNKLFLRNPDLYLKEFQENSFESTILNLPETHILKKIGKIIFNVEIKDTPINAAEEILTLLMQHNLELYQNIVEEFLNDDFKCYKEKYHHSPLSSKLIYEIFVWATGGNFSDAKKILNKYNEALANKDQNIISFVNTQAKIALEQPKSFDYTDFCVEFDGLFHKTLLAPRVRFLSIDQPSISTKLDRIPTCTIA